MNVSCNDIFSRRWNAELERAKRKNIKPSFKRAFVLTYLNYFMLSGFLALAWVSNYFLLFFWIWILYTQRCFQNSYLLSTYMYIYVVYHYKKKLQFEFFIFFLTEAFDSCMDLKFLFAKSFSSQVRFCLICY